MLEMLNSPNIKLADMSSLIASVLSCKLNSKSTRTNFFQSWPAVKQSLTAIELIKETNNITERRMLFWLVYMNTNSF